MVTRKEMYAYNKRRRKHFGIIRKKCKFCGCYLPNRHKIWCRSEEAEKLRNKKNITKSL